MERPAHLTVERRRFSRQRVVAISAALVLEAAAIYAIANGLAIGRFRFVPQALDVEFLESKPPEVRPLVLPRLELLQPPPPDVIQPEIQIQTPRPPPRITVARMHPRPFVAVPVQIAGPPAAAPAPPKPRGITAPVSIGASHSCERAYPSTALRLDQQGTTIIGFIVQADGSVSGVHVVRSSGHEMLDDAAIRCAAAWRYRPALANGQAVPARWTTNVQWKLQYGSRPM